MAGRLSRGALSGSGSGKRLLLLWPHPVSTRAGDTPGLTANLAPIVDRADNQQQRMTSRPLSAQASRTDHMRPLVSGSSQGTIALADQVLPCARLSSDFSWGGNSAVQCREETLPPVGGRLCVQSCWAITKPGTVCQ